MPNRLKTLGIGAALFFFLGGWLAAGSTDARWFTRVWQIDDGLLDNDINGIVQGPDDYLWLVTPVGLMRFDGLNFSSFATESLASRGGSHVRMMIRSHSGVLWMAFDGGKVVGLSPDYHPVPLDDKKLPTHAPVALAEDAAGALWLGYPEAIYRALNGQITRFDLGQGVPLGTVHSLASDGQGGIWLAKGNELKYFQNGKFIAVAGVEGVQCIGATHTNAIWLVANAHLLTCDPNGKLKDCGTFQDPNTRAAALLEDHHGAVWIGTDGNGLFNFQDAHFQRVETSHSTIQNLAEDREGNLWVGTGGGGLDRISPSGISLERLQNNQIQSQIQSLCQDSKGVLWGATQNGTLVSRVGSNWKPFPGDAPFSGTATCVAADSEAVWVGTRSGSLFRIVSAGPATWVTNITHAPIRGLLAAANGDLWISGSDTSLQRLRKNQLVTIRLPRQAQRVLALAEDLTGDIWIGANGPLFRYHGDTLENETARSGIARRPICCLYCTEDGSVWIGSAGGGLMRLKNGRVGQLGLNQGLVNDYISQVVADAHGWLWCGSKHGIFKLRQSEVNAAMDNPGLRLRPVIYAKNAGLISQEAVFSLASPFTLPHAVRSLDGRVWMLMHTGVVVADPEVLSDSTNPPPVLLTQTAMDGQIIAAHDALSPAESGTSQNTLNSPLKLPPSHRHLEFTFTAFHFRDPENLHFRYLLAGYDNDWIDAGAQRNAAYSRLADGKYQFRVEASVGDGPWSDPPTTLDFIVVPFFWQTWWFCLGVLLVFTCSVIAIVRYVSHRRLRLKLHAVEQLAAVERERGRIARDIHDDLGNRLTEIQLLTGLAQRNRDIPDNAVTQINEIFSAARLATDALDEIVWAINPGNDTLPHLINYLGQFTTDYMRTAGIPCRVDFPENPPAKSVSAEVRHNLFLAIKESLNNIVRHAGATEVSLQILVADKSLGIIIKDNGRGFGDGVKNQWADGLENMRRRVVEIGGEFQIKSQPGAGTCISFNGQWLAEN